MVCTNLSKVQPKADLYFLNPAGILFGPKAFLSVPGAFYASTADYLKMGKNGRFDAANPENSTLSIAPPATFGFLDDMPGSIDIEQSVLMARPDEKLAMVGGKYSSEMR